MAPPDPTTERLAAAARLMEAIAACHPADRVVLLSAVLETLAAGAPGAAFIDLHQEAKDWAGLATPQELEAYLVACAAQLARTPMPEETRRRIAAKLGRLVQVLSRPAVTTAISPRESAEFRK